MTRPLIDTALHVVRTKWRLLAAIALLFLVAFLFTHGNGRASRPEIAITSIGYTNPPPVNVRYALFSVSNQCPYAVRYRSACIQIEDTPGDGAAVVLFPNYKAHVRPGGIMLMVGESFSVAVPDPWDPCEARRWRIVLGFDRYPWRRRFLDFASRHKLPPKLVGIFLAPNSLKLKPAAEMIVSSDWLTE